ncbi:MAG: DUF3822 family protein [Bacteroidota bacterium]|nr:DUF3822 family protein [Bacteroidota bacterium]
MEIGENNIKKTELVSSNYNSANTSKYHLSIEIGLGLFSYAILDITNHKYKALVSHDIESIDLDENISYISKIYNNTSVLKKSFQSSSLSFAFFSNTLIPYNYFSKEYSMQILEFNHDIKHTTVLEDKLNLFNTYNVYAIPKPILEMTNTFFPNIQITSKSSILIDYLAKNHTSQNHKKLFLSVGGNYIEIVIFEGEKLLLQNIFNYKTKEDILYYVLFCMQELNLSTEKDSIILLDKIKKNDKLFSLLYAYIRNISFIKRSEQISIPKELNKIKEHQYTSLLHQILCG